VQKYEIIAQESYDKILNLSGYQYGSYGKLIPVSLRLPKTKTGLIF